MKFILFVLMLCVGSLQAETFQRSKGFTAGCENPTEREDGEVLCNGVNCTPNEIEFVRYYISKEEGDTNSPEKTFVLNGGCYEFPVDTKDLTINTVYYRFAETYTLDGQHSIVSTSIPFDLINSNPKSPKRVW